MEVTFKVDGEWLTGFFRTRFWDEKCGYDKAIKIIKDSLCDDISEDICIQLLEGRKKLVGVNEFDYVDDNENIRPLSLYIKEQERKNIEYELINDIKMYPYNYIDQYACSTSRPWMKPYAEELKSMEWWYDQLVYQRGNSESVLENGCTWFDRLNHTAKVIMYHTDKKSLDYKEFAEIVFKEYELTIEMLRQKGTAFNELDDYDQAIICRNRHYAMLNEIKWSYLEEKAFVTRKYLEKIEKEKKDKLEKIYRDELIKETIESANEPSNFLGSDLLNLISKSEPFDTNPTDPIGGWDGFIDREGNFYKTKPIGMGWYNGSANCHSEWAYQYIEEQNIKLDNDSRDAKDYLIYKMGWCDVSHFTLISKEVNVCKPRKGFTKEQEKTLFKIFQLNNDDMKKYYDLLDIKG